MRFITGCIFVAIATQCAGWEFPDEPIERALEQFRANYVRRCADLVAEFEQRLSGAARMTYEKEFAGFHTLLSNMRMNTLAIDKRLKQRDTSGALERDFYALATDLISFRRSVDALVIEASASKVLVVEDALLSRLRAFWMLDQYYTRRFRSASAPNVDRNPNSDQSRLPDR
jgi:hypothetical protein